MKLVYSLVLMFCASAAFSQNAVDWYNSGIDKFEEGNTLGAIKDFNASLALDSNVAEAYWGRGSVFAELEQFNEALRDLNKAITLNPQLSDAYYNRAYVYLAKNDEVRALNDLNMYVILEPEDMNGYLARLDILVQHSEHQKNCNA